ncbi:MAG: hypothetical protein JWQ74_3080 [Marmoricola sp.]|nr:hypothetical protein [Marmoricola sp.]
MPDPLAPRPPTDTITGPHGARTDLSADLRAGLGSLTTRGRCFLAGGITAAVCGVVLAERDLLRLGAVIALLPLVTVVLVARTSHRLGLVRTLSSPVVEVDRSITVRLEATNQGLRTGRLLAEEQVPWALGHRPRFILDALPSGASQHLEYQVRAEVRGVYQVGPLQLRVVDPFGMLSLERTFTRTSTLVVVPATEQLSAIALGGSGTSRGEDRPQPYSSGSVADATVRDYRYGDDLRRVHWPSTARTGEVMVRREEQPWQSRCTLLLDNRASAHRGAGPASSLERAITVAASIADHLTRRGFQVSLASADGTDPRQGWALEFLAALPASPAQNLTLGGSEPGGSPEDHPGIFIAVLGDLTQSDRDLLSRQHRRGSASYAIALDVDTWAGGAPSAGLSVGWLRRHGWRATDLARNGSLTTAWTELDR